MDILKTCSVGNFSAFPRYYSLWNLIVFMESPSQIMQHASFPLLHVACPSWLCWDPCFQSLDRVFSTWYCCEAVCNLEMEIMLLFSWHLYLSELLKPTFGELETLQKKKVKLKPSSLVLFPFMSCMSCCEAELALVSWSFLWGQLQDSAAGFDKKK